jgi:hypothetical protein
MQVVVARSILLVMVLHTRVLVLQVSEIIVSTCQWKPIRRHTAGIFAGFVRAEKALELIPSMNSGFMAI